MKLNRPAWFGALRGLATFLTASVLVSIALAQGLTTTTVQGTVYLANGMAGAGTLQLSWPAFTTAANQAVAAGRLTAPIGADGFVSVNLAPNLGATPAGLFYTAVYNMSDGTTSTEYWVVPAAAQASIAQVRAQVMPAVQATQAVNKAYVDQVIQSISQSSLSPSGGALTGPLYLSSDPTQAMQAADKHYVDSSFSQAVPLTGAALTGPLTSVELGAAYQVDQFAGADFGAKLQACIAALSSANGGTCDARNFTATQSMASNLAISTANATVLLPCATIATASEIIVTAGTRNVTLHGCALRGGSSASGSQGGTVFLYAGTGAMFQVGDPTYASDTQGFHLDNVVVNTTAAANATAQGLIADRTQELDLESLYFLGNSNQTGVTLDGTGNYTGGTFYDNAFNGFATAIDAIGHQASNPATTDWVNASTFVRLHIDCPTSNGNPVAGTYGVNLQQGDGNTFTGGDVEGCSTALHLGPNAQNNTIVGLRNENSTSQVVADSGSAYNNWITGGTMFTGKLTDNGTRNSFLDTFHRSFNGINGDWYGSQVDATVTNHYRLGIGNGNERGLYDRYQTDAGYRWTTGLSDATAGEQFYQILDELNNVYRLSIGQYNSGQSSTNNQTVVNAAGSGAVVLNGSNNAGTGGVVFGSGGANETTVATVSNAGNAQFNGTLQVGGVSTFTGSTTVRNQADAEIDAFLWAGATANQKESYIYKDFTGASQWYMVKDASNNWALNSAQGGLDSFKAYQSTNSGDTYINASNSTGVVRVNYENGSGTQFKIYGGNSGTPYASFTGATAIQFPGLAANSGHNCLQVDNSGYISNTSAACGSGNGTVNSGASGQIAYYSAAGTALSGLSAVPISAGGTGATSAATALAALGGQTSMSGVAPDGANGMTVAGGVSAKSLLAASTNGVLNEAYFPGSTVTARVQAACASQTTNSIPVIVPATETDTSAAIATTYCNIKDYRGVAIPPANSVVGTGYLGSTLDSTFETRTAPSTGYRGFAGGWAYYAALQGGSYWYPLGPAGAGSGTKTDYIGRPLYLTFNTIGQKTGYDATAWSTANGETMPIQSYMTEFAGYQGPGAEPSEGVRIQMQQGSSASGSSSTGGVLNGTITSITGSGPYTVAFSATNDLNTLGERCCIRDLGASYSAGTYTSISSASNTPVSGVTTVTVVGSGTAWTSLGTGSHTTFNSTASSNGFLPTSTNLCLTISSAKNDGYDVTLPIVSIVDDTHLTVIPQSVGTSANTGWFGNWPQSGSYKINGCALPSSTSQNAGAGTGTFTTLDASGLTSGHSIDQTLAYNTEFDGIQLLMRRHIGRFNYGSGINIVDNGTSGAPTFSAGVAVSGGFYSAFMVQPSGQAQQPGAIIATYVRPSSTAYADFEDLTAGNYSTYNFLMSRDSTGVLQKFIQVDPTTTDSTYGVIFPTGNLSVLNGVKFGSAQQTTFDANGVKHEAGTVPTASAGTIIGTNAGGYISGLSAAASVTITFANSGWTTWAACTANATVTAEQPYVTSTLGLKTGVTFTFPSSYTGGLTYSCSGN